MEYEIESETVLFDPSTNPSLLRWPLTPADQARRDRPIGQAGELTPDDEAVG